MKMTRFAFPEPKLTRQYLAAVIFTSIVASTSIGFAALAPKAQMIIDRVGW
jgi:hypothetical protein